MKKWFSWGLFIAACLVILHFTLFTRRVRPEHQFQPELFWSYRMWLKGEKGGKAAVIQNLKNILLFIPFGLLLPKRKWKSVLIGAAIFSICIEFLQWTFKLGLAELDDAISNVAGAMLGFGAFCVCEKIMRK